MEENKLIYVFILYLSYEKEKKEGMKMPYKVYCYTGKNGKKYVGQTCQSIARRAEGGHGYCKNNNSVFGQAIKKYGFDFFDVEILKDNLETKSEADYWEQYYIKTLNTLVQNGQGYNIVLGGGGSPLYDYENIYELWKEGFTVGEIRETLKCGVGVVQTALDFYNVDPEERRLRALLKRTSKMVYQYDLQGNYIASYLSLAEAERATKIPHSSIGDIAKNNGTQGQAGGYQWSFEYYDKITPYKKALNGRARTVYKCDNNNIILQEFETVKSAAESVGSAPSALRASLKASHRFKNFYWWYADEWKEKYEK